MSGATFGRKGAPAGDDMAARRAAFVAQERARSTRAPGSEEVAPTGNSRSPGAAYGPPPTREPVFVSRKTNGTAYMLWFFFGGLSAHRFYLGQTASAFVQLMLAPLGYALLVTKSPMGMVLVTVGGLWLIADAFLIPGLVTKVNERARKLAYSTAFD